MKEKIAKIKELWAIPRYKALIKLVLFALFFLSIYLIIFIMSLFNEPSIENNEVEKNTLENYLEMNNYEYEYNITYIINKENLTKKIIGTKYEDINNFKILSNDYHIENNQIYDENNQIVDNLNEYDLLKLEPSEINEMILVMTNKNIIKYNDGKIKTMYNSDIQLITYEENNYIYKIELDLTNYLAQTNNKINYYFIEINYTNINNISSYN